MKTFISVAIAIFFGLSLMAQSSANLKLNLEKNKTYKAKTTSTQTISQTINGMQQSTEMKSTMVLSVKPVNISADYILAEVCFDSIINNTNMAGRKMDMNSSKPGNMKSSDPMEIMGCLLYRLSKSILSMKIAYTGNVVEISNMKSITDSVMLGVDSLQGAAKMVQMQAKMLINELSLKGMIEAVTAYLPGKQVKVGDQWESRINQSSSGIGILTINKLKLKKIDGNQAEVAGEATIEPLSSAPIEMNGAQITYDVRGLSKSNLTIDTKTCWVIKGTSKQHLQGNVNVKMQGNEMQIPVEVDGTSDIVSIP